MSTRNSLVIILVVALALALAGAVLQPRMETPLATHWNAQGAADGYGGTFEALYLLPLILLATSLLVLGLPRLDPMRTAKLNFGLVNWVILMLAGFLSYLHILTLAWNLGSRFNMNQMLTPAMGFLFIFMGLIIRKAQPNWFVGIRTPWTLSNTVVWEKTHDLGGKLFIASGVISLFGILFPNAAIWLLMAPVLLAALATVIYSYIVFRQIDAKAD